MQSDEKFQQKYDHFKSTSLVLVPDVMSQANTHTFNPNLFFASYIEAIKEALQMTDDEAMKFAHEVASKDSVSDRVFKTFASNAAGKVRPDHQVCVCVWGGGGGPVCRC